MHNSIVQNLIKSFEHYIINVCNVCTVHFYMLPVMFDCGFEEFSTDTLDMHQLSLFMDWDKMSLNVHSLLHYMGKI